MQLSFGPMGMNGRFSLDDYLKVFEPNEIDWTWWACVRRMLYRA